MRFRYLSPSGLRRICQRWNAADAGGYSRRQVLKLGAALFAVPPMVSRAFTGTENAAPKLTVESDGVTLRFGNTVWTIAKRWFAGTPRLWGEQVKDRIVLSLRNARVAGTDFIADFRCSVMREDGVWRIRFDFRNGLRFEGDLQQWMTGQPLVASVGLPQVIQTGRFGSIEIPAAAHCTFGKDWQFRWQVQKREMIRLEAAHCRVAARKVALSIGSNLPSVFQRSIQRRAVWNFEQLSLAHSKIELFHTHWRIKDFPFVAVVLETAETRRKVSRAALAAIAVSDTVAEIFSTADSHVRLQICCPEFLLYDDGSYREGWLAGHFPKQRWWIHTPGASFEIGGGKLAKPFQLRFVAGQTAAVQCEPQLHRIRLALADAFVDAAEPLFPTTLQISDHREGRRQRKRRQSRLPLGTHLGAVLGDTLSFVVLRPEDLLYLRFDFTKVKLQDGTIQVNAQSRLIVTFAPQSIAERAFFEAAGSSEKPGMPPVAARLSGESRCVFRFPANITSLPLRLSAFLDWNAFEPVVAANALPPALSQSAETALGITSITASLALQDRKWQRAGIRAKQQARQSLPIPATKLATLTQRLQSPASRRAATEGGSALQLSLASVKDFTVIKQAQVLKPEPPTLLHTAIELPYRLFLSPHRFAAWEHRQTLPPAAEQFTVELWHTRLGVKAKGGGFDAGNVPLRTVRAIWSWDALPTPPNPNDLWPFRSSLTRNDRYQIVHLSSNFTLANYTPAPIQVRHLMLTALGGWLDSEGIWQPPAGFDVQEWAHRATLGRDHFVRVVYAGFLWPFGHRASLVKITERKFRRTPKGTMAAYLIQRQFIVVRQPVKTFPATGLPGQRYEGRKLPFRQIALHPLVTPPLDDPAKTGIAGLGNQAFWIQVAGQRLLFRCAATDWEGKDVEFTMPLIFIKAGANTLATLNAVQAAYHSQQEWRTVDLAGQSVAYAPPATAGDTRFETASLLFNVSLPTASPPLDAAQHPYFYPEMERAQIRIQQLEALLGTGATTAVRLFGEGNKGFLPAGFDPTNNKGEIFLELLNPIALDFSQNTDKAGGLAAPNVKIQAISRGIGPVGANSPFTDFLNGTFDPSKFFDQVLEAKIVGSVKLKHILKILTFAAMAAAEVKKIPKLIQRALYDFAKDVNKIKKDIEDRFESAVDTIEALPGVVSAAIQDIVSAIRQQLSQIKSLAQNIWGMYQSTIDELGTTDVFELLDLLRNRTDAVSRQLRQQLEELARLKEEVAEKFEELRALVDQESKATQQLAKEIRQKYEQWKQFIDEIRKGITLEYRWETDKLQSWPSGTPLFETFHTADRQTKLVLKTAAYQPWASEPPMIQIRGELQHFAVHLIAGIMEFLAVDFARLTLRSKNFEKVRVDVDIADIQFKGPLSFVGKLQELIPKGGFGDYLPKIDLFQNPGLLVSYKLGLPSISVGVLSIQNLSLFFSLKIPFVAEPVTLRFGFCERHDPFRLTVYVFGGGGFFALELTPAGVSLLEAAFEFGGCFAFSVAVAQGSAGAMVGIYFRMVFQNGGNLATLEGYFRMWGELRVLGIISVSAVLYMALTWQSNGKVYGQASLVVEIQVLFFSKSVSITVERQFKGSSGDPTFGQMFPDPQQWTQYCLAFA